MRTILWLLARIKGQCPGGGWCFCCSAGCDCGCRDVCPAWRFRPGRRRFADERDEGGDTDYHASNTYPRRGTDA